MQHIMNSEEPILRMTSIPKPEQTRNARTTRAVNSSQMSPMKFCASHSSECSCVALNQRFTTLSCPHFSEQQCYQQYWELFQVWILQILQRSVSLHYARANNCELGSSYVIVRLRDGLKDRGSIPSDGGHISFPHFIRTGSRIHPHSSPNGTGGSFHCR
jgi:hypothetical protein